MSVTFPVSDVAPITTSIETVAVETAIHRLMSRMTIDFEARPPTPTWPPLRRCEGIGSGTAEVVAAAYHPFVHAVALAFHEHRPLRLTPDQVWLVIEQGLALHIQENSEALRARFVEHDGRERITVQRDDFVLGQPNPWHEMVDAFRAEIRARIGKKHDLFVVDFSTSTEVSRTASSIVLMGAMQSYFEYDFLSLCGIPSIEVAGTTDDWRSIRQRVEYLREFELGRWVDSLLPVLDQFVAASQGQIQDGFWRSIYKRNGGSGGPYITGWVQLFFPYLRSALLDSPSSGLQWSRHHQDWQAGMASEFGGGPTMSELPLGLSSVPFRWQYLDQSIDMELLGGFVGVEQAADGVISPAVGWAVRRA